MESLGKLFQALSLDELKELNNKLIAHSKISLFEMHGFLSAIISAPTHLSSQKWLPYVFSQEEVFLLNENNHKLVLELLRLHNQIAQIFCKKEYFIPLISFKPIELMDSKHFDKSTWKNLEDWCYGYLQGVEMDYESWTHKSDSEIIDSLLLVYVLADRNRSKRTPLVRKLELGLSTQLLWLLQHENVERLPQVVTSIYQYWLNRVPAKPPFKKLKTELLDDCPCGSGLQYRQCCLRNDLV